jgi:hypothetical protein
VVRDGGLHPSTDRKKLRALLVSTYRSYRGVANSPTPEEIADEVERVFIAARDVNDDLQHGGRTPRQANNLGNLRSALRHLSKEAREALDHDGLDEWRVPTGRAIQRNAVLQQHAPLIMQHATLSVRWTEGRARPGGKRSQPSLGITIAAPSRRIGRPSLAPEFWFVTGLRAISHQMGGPLPAVARGSSGPFVGFVGGVFKLANLLVSPAEAINWGARQGKRKAARASRARKKARKRARKK